LDAAAQVSHEEIAALTDAQVLKFRSENGRLVSLGRRSDDPISLG
jgi:hypothetical protein